MLISEPEGKSYSRNDQCVGAQERSSATCEPRAKVVAAEHVPVDEIQLLLNLGLLLFDWQHDTMVDRLSRSVKREDSWRFGCCPFRDATSRERHD
jgi:hypothetical protein